MKEEVGDAGASGVLIGNQGDTEDRMLPPSGISAAARLATSVKEKQEITIVFTKFSRLVSA